MKGFISLHRKLMDNPIWSDPNYLKLWIYCLFEASHKDREQLVGNKIVSLKRGQFVTGRFSLAEEMNKGVKPKQRLNERTWWRHLNNFEQWGMLTIKSTNKYSVVTIDNYDVYQNVFSDNAHKTDHQLSNKSPTTDQQMSTNNNVNNVNNVINATTDSAPEENHQKILNRYMELKGHFMFSPKDETAAKEIEQSGIPPDKAIEFLEERFRTFQPKHSRDKINSLDYCVGFILDRYHEEKEGESNGSRVHGSGFSNATGTGKGTSYEQAIRELEAAERAFGR
ncbi:hypothetical protein [Virgibacillus sp. YIM 98842]|uniref:hypothetical protein n=1 Tax=Virgibacillus sp. YIM 98842 TaxID=2663533 RepID=UPI0013D9780C|nr:hypothetical protein [Virgibacillus sp. YIM 98842]